MLGTRGTGCELCQVEVTLGTRDTGHKQCWARGALSASDGR